MIRNRGLPPVTETVPNLAPLVDVVMVILIFFMLGATFAVSEGALPTDLPSDVGPGGEAAVSIIPEVRIDLLPGDGPEQCRVFVMGRPLEPTSGLAPAARETTFDALRDYLRIKIQEGADPQGRVVISADASVRYGFVISAMDACLQAGFRNVQFAVGSLREEP
jgi:biopolymer transport protein ExbD